MSLFKKFKEFFFKPSLSDHERIERWKKEVDEAGRLKELHRNARKQDQKPKKGLRIEDFEHANRLEKQKNKTLSSNF